MKIYTKTGDHGQTGLFGGPRVDKHHPRIEAYGAVDELNAALGIARITNLPAEMDALLFRAQNELFTLGGELASPDPQKLRVAVIGERHIAALEAAIDDYEAGLAPLREFILPGGSPGAAALHMARTICRRAERDVSRLTAMADENVSPVLLIFLNRLSDLLFVLARAANAAVGEKDVPWRQEKRPNDSSA